MKVATELQQVSLPFDEGGKENVMMMEQFVLHEVETPLYSGLGEVLFAGLEFVSFQIEPEYLEADGHIISGVIQKNRMTKSIISLQSSGIRE